MLENIQRVAIKLLLTKIENKELIIDDNGNIYKCYKNNRLLPKLIDTNSKGYKVISIRVKDKKVTVKQHRLLYAYYHGEDKLDDNLTIHHINNIKTDNRKCNLDLITDSKNTKYRNEEYGSVFKDNNPNKILSKEQVYEIKKLLVIGQYSLDEIAHMYGVVKSTISVIKRGKAWNHVEVNGNYKRKKQNYKNTIMNNPNTVFNDDLVKKIREEYKESNMTMKEMARKYKINYITMSDMLSGRTWSDVK